MACTEEFRDSGLPVFYVHPEKDSLIWLHPKDEPSHDLEDKAKLHHFLPAYGAAVEHRGSTSVLPAWRELGRSLIQQIDAYAKPIRTLNWYASKAGAALNPVAIHSDHKSWEELQALFDLFIDAAVLKISNNKIVFADENARFFANGGWLEQYVYSEVMALKKHNPKIQDVAQSLEVARSDKQGKPIKNELDVAFLADNRLYIIECKTKRFDQMPTGNESDGADTLYKLDTLRDLYGGLHSNGMLVSYLPLSTHDRRRTEDLRIKVCDASQLKNLPSLLAKWGRCWSLQACQGTYVLRSGYDKSSSFRIVQ